MVTFGGNFFRTVLLVAFLVVAAASLERNWLRRRTPVTVSSPEYIRLSNDPEVLETEKFVARSKGVNVCVSRERKIEKHITLCKRNPRKCPRHGGFKHAAATMPRYYTKYKCCPGYEAVKNQKGCPKDKFSSKHNIIQVAAKLGLSTFVNLARRSMLFTTLRYRKHLTILVPTNKAFANFFQTAYGAKVQRMEYLQRILLAMHIFGGKLPSVMLKKRRSLESFLPGQARVVNILSYGNQLVIQNALVLKKDQSASNGIIHVVDSIIHPSHGRVEAMVKQYKQVSMFNMGLEAVNLKLTGYNTLFIPSNEAFRRAGITTQTALKQHFKCLKEFLATHIVPWLFFPAVLKRRPRFSISNLARDRLNLLYQGRKFYINRILVKTKFFAATNGVVFIINQLLVTPKALHIQKVLQSLSSVSMVTKMMNQTDFEGSHLPSNQSYTLFVPSNRAMMHLGKKRLAELNRNESAIKFLQAHVTIGKYSTKKLTDNMQLSTFNKHAIRINRQKGKHKFCVQGSMVSYRLRNIEACNAVIHVITSQPIQHSEQSILDIIQSHPKLSLLSMALHLTNLRRTLDKKSPLTFFAPSNDAWQKLDNETLVRYFQDDQSLIDVLEYHMMLGTLYTCNLSRRKTSPFSVAGARVRLSLTLVGTIRFNYAETVESDIVANNGVVHIIDDVVLYLYKRRYYG